MIIEVPVFYATTEGQTRRIAEHLAATLRQHGLASRALDVFGGEADQVNWSTVRGALVGASLHGGRHQSEAGAFARRHVDQLNGLPSGFFSVGLSAGSSDSREVETAHALAQAFPASVGWQPNLVACFAGRLAYTEYGPLKRFVMKRIAKKEGASTDTSRDHEFTNWHDVNRLAADLAALLPSPPEQPETTSARHPG